MKNKCDFLSAGLVLSFTVGIKADQFLCIYFESVAIMQTFSPIFPKWVRKTKISKRISKMLVNHLGLTLTEEDLQDVVDQMEPYGQISNGIELLSPPLDVSYLID